MSKLYQNVMSGDETTREAWEKGIAVSNAIHHIADAALAVGVDEDAVSHALVLPHGMYAVVLVEGNAPVPCVFTCIDRHELSIPLDGPSRKIDKGTLDALFGFMYEEATS